MFRCQYKMASLLVRFGDHEPMVRSYNEFNKVARGSKIRKYIFVCLAPKLKDTKCLLLSLRGDGRYLCHKDREQTFSWSTVDFDVPFPHVLQDRMPKMLSFWDFAPISAKSPI